MITIVYFHNKYIIMKRLAHLLLIALILSCTTGNKQEYSESNSNKDESEEIGVYELRTYYAAEGKLENLLARFRDHTLKLFEKHGMTNIGYWVPVDNEGNTLVYLLGHKNRDDRDQSFENFRNDPEWIKAKTESEVDGKLVDSIDNVFLKSTPYSPALKLEDKGPRIFELRTYYTNEGKLDNLHARFENHTMAIFENNNMTNTAYFDLDVDQGDNTLIYFITHADTAAARTNWGNFLNDPDWQSAYSESIQDGRLVSSITSEYLLAVDFSPLK